MKLILLVVVSMISFATIMRADVKIAFNEKSSCPDVVCGSGRIIYVDGEIGPKDAIRLEVEIISHGSPAFSTVYLNSPGGSLFAGMEIGRVIRKYGYNTAIGIKSEGSIYKGDGVCYSACTLAYLGGVFRYASDRNRYGVHRFYSEMKTAEAEQTAQIASGEIVAFLNEMEISSEFFIEMTKTGSETLKVISSDQMLKMGLSNNRTGSTSWSINAPKKAGSSSFLYLKGERDTQFGINKIMFFCTPQDGMVMGVIYDPQGRVEEAKMMLSVTIELDGTILGFSERRLGEIEIVNGWANSYFSLSDTTWSLIRSSDELSVRFQISKDAPVFLGVSAMPLQDAKDLMSGLAATCLN